MTGLGCALLILIGYVTAYLVSVYSLAVYIDPDDVEALFPAASPRQTSFLQRLGREPRAFMQVATVYKAFALILISACTVRAVHQEFRLAGWQEAAAYVGALLLVWLLYVFFAEYLPRRTSRTAVNERMLRYVWVIAAVYYFCYPVMRWYRGAIERSGAESPVTEEEKDEIVERAIETLAENAGIGEALVEAEEKEMIEQIFLLDQTVVREIMVPRIDITAIDKSMSFREIRELVLRDGHSRYPVFEGSIDKIVGLLYVKDLFNKMPQPGEVFDIGSYLRKPYLVPETKVIGELLKEFKTRRQHIAVVADEYGGVAGLVTLEDIIEEIFGEIQDEHDAEEAELRELPQGGYIVSAGLLVEKLQDLLDTDYEQGDYDTVGGLIYDLVGSVPHEGQRIRWHALEFEVERVEGQRIVSVIVHN